MQRRAAAAYAGFFLLIAAVAAYGSFSGRYGDLSHNFWGIFVLSTVAGVVLYASAAMPVRRE